MPDDTRTILCVDDSPASLGAWIELFDRSSFRSIATTDPRFVLPILRCVPVHLAILDYFMPGLDGGALAANIREQSAIPIILASNSVLEIPPKVQNLVSAIVPKQDGLAALIRVVRSLLASR